MTSASAVWACADEFIERAKRAEALGFEAIFFADSQMNNVDPYQAMAMCAVSTTFSIATRSSSRKTDGEASTGGANEMSE